MSVSRTKINQISDGTSNTFGFGEIIGGTNVGQRDFVASWVDLGKPALEAAGPNASFTDLEAAVVRLSLQNLMTFPWIAEAVAAGRLSLAGFMFDIHTGVLTRVAENGIEPVE